MISIKYTLFICNLIILNSCANENWIKLEANSTNVKTNVNFIYLTDTVALSQCKCTLFDSIIYIDIFRNTGWSLDQIHLELSNNGASTWIRIESDIGGLTIKLNNPVNILMDDIQDYNIDSIVGKIKIDQSFNWVDSNRIEHPHSFLSNGSFKCKLEMRPLEEHEFERPNGMKYYE
ncbi:MAG: hypothetical protein ACI8QQ_003191 [Psychroserpens sp.]|jgi:hypothetical protein